jgi:hypothetical protein
MTKIRRSEVRRSWVRGQTSIQSDFQGIQQCPAQKKKKTLEVATFGN